MKWHETSYRTQYERAFTWKEIKELYWDTHLDSVTIEPYRGIWIIMYKHATHCIAYSIPDINTSLYGYQTTSVEKIKQLVDMELDVEQLLTEATDEHHIDLNI